MDPKLIIGLGIAGAGALYFISRGGAGKTRTGGGVGSGKKEGMGTDPFSQDPAGDTIYNIVMPEAPLVEFPQIPWGEFYTPGGDTSTTSTKVSTKKRRVIPTITRETARKYGVSHQLSGRITTEPKKEVIIPKHYDLRKQMRSL